MVRKAKFAFATVALMTFVASAGPRSSLPVAKLTVCHGPIGQWGKVLDINPDQLDRHRAHGDYELPAGYTSSDGRCPGLLQ